MIKALLIILTKLAESRLEKAGVETLILKNENHITVAKQIWYMIDENFRISTTVEEKLKSKVDEFNKAILAKFPELSQADIDSLRQSIAGEFNAGKQAVVDNSTIIQQLQNQVTSLTTENLNLKNQLSQVQSVVTVNTKTENSVSPASSETVSA